MEDTTDLNAMGGKRYRKLGVMEGNGEVSVRAGGFKTRQIYTIGSLAWRRRNPANDSVNMTLTRQLWVIFYMCGRSR